MDAEFEEILRVYGASCEEALFRLETCVIEVEQDPQRDAELEEALRLCHTVKGDSATVGFEPAHEIAHLIEGALVHVQNDAQAVSSGYFTDLLGAIDALRDLIDTLLGGREVDAAASSAQIESMRARLDPALQRGRPDVAAPRGKAPRLARRAASPAPESAPAESTDPSGRATRRLRIDIGAMDRMLNLTGELAIARSRVARLLSGTHTPTLSALRQANRETDLLFQQLQDEVVRARMVPIGPVFRQHIRTVRDVAIVEGKRARLEICGEEAELDTTVVDSIRDCLGHIIRNAIAHGIEMPKRRLAQGKQPIGCIRLDARHEGGSLVVEVGDDGAGLDLVEIERCARSRGLIDDAKQLAEDEIAQLIFEPGFSTRSRADRVSGRGVGMNVVRKQVEALGGTIRVDSRAGAGCTLSMRLPLTIAIIDGLNVCVGDEIYVLPLRSVIECIDLSGQPARRRTPTGVVDLRGRPLPYARLRRVVGVAGKPPERESIVVVSDGRRQMGIAVDTLLGESQAVIKPLARRLQELPGIAGSTILASGDVALILDIPALMHASLQASGAGTASNRAGAETN